jgi:hypothetical protein
VAVANSTQERECPLWVISGPFIMDDGMSAFPSTACLGNSLSDLECKERQTELALTPKTRLARR